MRKKVKTLLPKFKYIFVKTFYKLPNIRKNMKNSIFEIKANTK